ncbi:MAG: hypothetical protein LBB30_01390 [Candidatus Methanoplasma sp.]|jgi:hypothetical protein|nr:hypothetical protein [Candidatus Methanoplasma sp.]
MVKTAVIAVVVIAVVAIAAVGAFIMLSGDDKDPNDVTFLIQDEDGVYFWIDGNGETALDALENALSAYPEGTFERSTSGVGSLFGNGFVQDSAGKYTWWVQFTWKDDKWACNTVGMNSILSKDAEYLLIMYGQGNMSDPAATQTPEGTPAPKDKAVWNGDTKGTVFRIEAGSGLYFEINGTGGETLMKTFKNACEKYKVPVETAGTAAYGEFLQGLFGITSSQDAEGNWLYWAEYEYKSGGLEPSNIGRDGLKSSDNPRYALIYGDGSAGSPT